MAIAAVVKQGFFRGEYVEVLALTEGGLSEGCFVDIRRRWCVREMKKGQRGAFYFQDEHWLVLAKAVIEAHEVHHLIHPIACEDIRLKLLGPLTEAEEVEFLREYFIANYL